MLKPPDFNILLDPSITRVLPDVGEYMHAPVKSTFPETVHALVPEVIVAFSKTVHGPKLPVILTIGFHVPPCKLIENPESLTVRLPVTLIVWLPAVPIVTVRELPLAVYASTSPP